MSKWCRIFICLALVAVVPVAAFATGGAKEEENELPNLIGLFAGHDSALYHWVSAVYAVAVSLILCGIALIVYRRRKMIPGPLQNAVEMLAESMYNLVHSILGKDAKKYAPFLGSLFFYILFLNFMGILPGGHAPSTNRNVTAALAIIAVVTAHYTGITRLGILGYLHHMVGSPRTAITWALSPLMFIIHLFGEAAKPVSLAARLFGNITGEDLLVAAFVGLGIMVTSFMHSPVGLPLQVPFIALGILLSTIQALVFTLLSTIYILLMLPHEEEQH